MNEILHNDMIIKSFIFIKVENQKDCWIQKLSQLSSIASPQSQEFEQMDMRYSSEDSTASFHCSASTYTASSVFVSHQLPLFSCFPLFSKASPQPSL